MGVEFHQLGKKALEEGKFKLAESYFRQAIEKEPDNFIFKYDLGIALLKLKLFTEALKHFSEIMPEPFGNDKANVWYRLADCHRGLGEDKEARRAQLIADGFTEDEPVSVIPNSMFPSTNPSTDDAAIYPSHSPS